MKKGLLAGLFILFFFNLSICQVDNLNFSQSRRRDIIWNLFTNTPHTYQALPIKDFTETSLYTKIKLQPISEKQTPNKVLYVGFRSRGIFTSKNKLKLYGNLDFYRSYAKESAYLLMHNNSKEFSKDLLQNPHYPIAIRDGDNENQHYNLHGGLTGYIKKKIPFNFDVEYNVERFFGMTTPKTEQKLINYAANIKLGYQIYNHTIYGIVTAKKRQNNFSYNQKSIAGIPINQISKPNFYAGFSIGYGDVLGYNYSLLAGFLEKETYSYALGYSLNYENFFLNLVYDYSDNKEKYFSTDYVDTKNLAAIFYVEKHHLGVSNITSFNSNQFITTADIVIGEGKNAQRFLGYTENSLSKSPIYRNYKQNLNIFSFSSDWNKIKNGITKYGTLLGLSFTDEEIIDLNTTFKQVSRLNADIRISKDFRINSKSFVNVEPGISCYLPVSYSLNYNQSNSSTSKGSVIPPRQTFGKDVIVFDQNYDTLKRIGGVVTINYNLKIKDNTVINITGDILFESIEENKLFQNTTNTYFNLNLNLRY